MSRTAGEASTDFGIRNSSRGGCLEQIVALGILVLALLALSVAKNLGLTAFNGVTRYLSETETILERCLLLVSATTCAVLLFFLKIKSPIIYGTIEIVFAITSLFMSTEQALSGSFNAPVALITGIYFLIRGFDNVYKGLQDSKRYRR